MRKMTKTQVVIGITTMAVAAFAGFGLLSRHPVGNCAL
jgi:hypothetical protein